MGRAQRMQGPSLRSWYLSIFSSSSGPVFLFPPLRPSVLPQVPGQTSKSNTSGPKSAEGHERRGGLEVMGPLIELVGMATQDLRSAWEEGGTSSTLFVSSKRTGSQQAGAGSPRSTAQ